MKKVFLLLAMAISLITCSAQTYSYGKIKKDDPAKKGHLAWLDIKGPAKLVTFEDVSIAFDNEGIIQVADGDNLRVEVNAQGNGSVGYEYGCSLKIKNGKMHKYHISGMQMQFPEIWYEFGPADPATGIPTEITWCAIDFDDRQMKERQQIESSTLDSHGNWTSLKLTEAEILNILHIIASYYPP